MALYAALFQLAVMFVFPVVFWWVLTKHLAVSRRFIGIGALTWLCALPFIIGVPLAASAVFGQTAVVWSVALSFAAGIAEEGFRYFWYRRNPLLTDPTRWREAVVTGAGHGGFESIVLGLQAAFGVVMLFFMRDMLPAEMRAYEPTPASFITGALSRMLIVVGHIGLTLLVWRAVSRRKPVYLAVAIAAHIGVNLIAFLQPTLWPGQDWLGWVVIVGLFALAVVQWRILSHERPALQAAT